MTVRRLAAKDCLQSCGLTSKGLSLCLFELNYTRIRGRTLRDESLETNTARDLEQVVRMFVEMDVGPVSPSSTTQDVSIIYQLLFINKKTQYTL